MVKTLVSSKGQTTIPAKYRARWKSSEGVWEDMPDGSARVRPVPDILSLFGSASSAQLRDPDEKTKARTGWAAQPVKKRKYADGTLLPPRRQRRPAFPAER